MRRATSVLAAVGAISALAVPAAASASVLLNDNFAADSPTLDWGGDAMFLSRPTATGVAAVDLMGAAACPTGAECVNLDGAATGETPAGKLVSQSIFGPGSYTVSFEMAGNGLGGPAETTLVKLGGKVIDTLTLASGAPWQSYTLDVTTTAGSRLKFKELGPADGEGSLLADVTLSTGPSGNSGAVPEPATWAMMLAGVFGVGAMMRIRRDERAVQAA